MGKEKGIKGIRRNVMQNKEKKEEKKPREDLNKSSTNHEKIKKIISDPDKIKKEEKKYTEDE